MRRIVRNTRDEEKEAKLRMHKRFFGEIMTVVAFACPASFVETSLFLM